MDTALNVAVNNFGDTRSGGLAGPMGLFIIVLMSIATVLLIRNMNKRLRRLPDSFPVTPSPARAAEVARLEADLARSESAEGRTGAGAAPESAPKSTAEAEVSAADAKEHAEGDDARD